LEPGLPLIKLPLPFPKRLHHQVELGGGSPKNISCISE